MLTAQITNAIRGMSNRNAIRYVIRAWWGSHSDFSRWAGPSLRRDLLREIIYRDQLEIWGAYLPPMHYRAGQRSLWTGEYFAPPAE